MEWLVTDFGPNFGDNFRGFTFIKALKAAHPEARLTCWITPELHSSLSGLLPFLGFVDRFLVRPRGPQDSYRLIFDLLKRGLADGKPFTLSHLPGGAGPDGAAYHKLIPTAEPWFLAKLLAQAPLEGPDLENQGETLCRLLELSPEAVAAQLPLFGQRGPAGDLLCVGLSRPRKSDRKQLAPGRVAEVWRALAESGRPLAALDYQDWSPPPPIPGLLDLRLAPWEEKVELLNRAAWFIGSDGGLLHFAAACGSPTLGFYGADPTGRHGPLVGPFPRQTPFGEHRFFHEYRIFLAATSRLVEGWQVVEK